MNMIGKRTYGTPKVAMLTFNFMTAVTASNFAPQMTYNNRNGTCVQTGTAMSADYSFCNAWSGQECNINKDWDDD